MLIAAHFTRQPCFSTSNQKSPLGFGSGRKKGDLRIPTWDVLDIDLANADYSDQRESEQKKTGRSWISGNGRTGAHFVAAILKRRDRITGIVRLSSNHFRSNALTRPFRIFPRQRRRRC